MCTYVHPFYARLPKLNDNPSSGAKLAYCDENTFGHKSVVALYGSTARRFAEYDIDNGTWTPLDDAPCNVDIATSLTTNAAVGGDPRILAAFGNDEEGDCPHRFRPYATPQWDELNDNDTHFPDDITHGSSMAIGANDVLYLLPGGGNDFYGVDISGLFGGQQARFVPGGSANAHAVMVRDGIEVEYQLPAAAHVRASLHDALGRRVGAVDAGKQNAGTHRLSWNGNQEGRKLSAGAYFVSLDMGVEQVTLKTVIE